DPAVHLVDGLEIPLREVAERTVPRDPPRVADRNQPPRWLVVEREPLMRHRRVVQDVGRAVESPESLGGVDGIRADRHPAPLARRRLRAYLEAERLADACVLPIGGARLDPPRGIAARRLVVRDPDFDEAPLPAPDDVVQHRVIRNPGEEALVETRRPAVRD